MFPEVTLKIEKCSKLFSRAVLKKLFALLDNLIMFLLKKAFQKVIKFLAA